MTPCKSSTESESRCCTSVERDGSLQGESHGEESLDDVIVEVARDQVAVGQYVHFAHPPLRGRQLPRERRLVDEGGHHVELFVAERLCSVVPQGHQYAGDGVGGPRGKDQRRAVLSMPSISRSIPSRRRGVRCKNA